MKLKNFTNIEQYERAVPQVLAAPGAVSLSTYVTLLDVDGTDAHTCAAPRFAGQRKRIIQRTGTNTPVGSLTVTGMRVATQDVFAGFDRTTAQLAAAPRQLDLHSPDGVVWDIEGMIGVTVS